MMENTKKTDRRVKYTKTVLKDALMRRLLEKPIDKITVKELCADADVNRSTFYAHFADPMDLLKQIEQDLFADLIIYLGDLYETEDEAESLKTLTRVFEYIVENVTVCKVLLGEHGDTEFIKDLLMLVERGALKEWRGKIRADADTIEYCMIFSVYGSVGVIRKWFKDDLDKTAEQMSNVIMSLTLRGLSMYMR